ncbi:MAG: hypothetical protein ABEJ88_09780 [Halobacterium sp.]
MFELVDPVAAVGIDTLHVLAAGPPTDLPAPVPDFVGDALGSVRSFIQGGVQKLGKVVSDLTPGGL